MHFAQEGYHGMRTRFTERFGLRRISRNPETASIRLEYEGMEVSHSISLVSIRPPFGGRRWYFCCPVEHIRVTKLFLPPGARRFASRQAHGLPDFIQIRAKRMKMPAA